MKIQFDSLTGNSTTGVLKSSICQGKAGWFVLRGFYMSFGNDDHHIKEINVRLTEDKYSLQDSSYECDYTCNMKDESGHYAKEVQIDATLIVQAK